jgi:hypothetical protein
MGLGATALPALPALPALLAACQGGASGTATSGMPAAGKLTPGTRVTFLDSGGYLTPAIRAQQLLPQLDQWQQRTGLVFEPIDRGTTAC